MKAATKITPILVDCDWGKKNTDVSGKYGVRGYPTVIFTDPKGEVVARMSDRSAGSITKLIDDLAKRYKKKDAKEEEELEPVELPFLTSLEKGLAQGKKEGKLVLAVFGDVSEEAIETARSILHKDNAKLIAQFVGVQHAIAEDCELCAKYKARRGSLVLVLDPADPANPLSFIQGKRSAKSLARSLEKVLKDREKQD